MSEPVNAILVNIDGTFSWNGVYRVQLLSSSARLMRGLSKHIKTHRCLWDPFNNGEGGTHVVVGSYPLAQPDVLS